MTSNLPRWEGDSTTPFVLNLAQDLQALGWEVDMLAPHAPGAAADEILGGVSVERFRYFWPESQQTVCYDGGALINLRKNPANRLKLPVLVGAEFAAVIRRLLTRKYDIIHSHWILPQGFASLAAQIFKPVPHVVTVHGGDVFGLRGRVMAQLKRLTLRHADAVTVNSSFTERAVLELAPNINRLNRIPMGVSTVAIDSEQIEQSRRIRESHRRNKGPLLLFVGRIVEEKGVEDLLRALALLREKLPGVTAVVVGEGQDRLDMEHLAKSLGIADRTTFVGWAEPKYVRAYMAAADIFLGPSRIAQDGWVEAQGLTFLEAMVAGTPVIATRLGGIMDSVEDGITGLLVDERAPDQIAEAVCRLATNLDMVQDMTEKARRNAMERFSRESSATAFSDLFQALTQQESTSAFQ